MLVSTSSPHGPPPQRHANRVKATQSQSRIAKVTEQGAEPGRGVDAKERAAGIRPGLRVYNQDIAIRWLCSQIVDRWS